MFKLKSYLSENNITYAAFAVSVGVTQASIARYVNGKRFPHPRIIKKIAKITNNYVSPSDWYQDNFTAVTQNLMQQKETSPSPEFVDGCAASRAGYEQNDAQQSLGG
ncbi:helix-turn-helix domain-containing protein [Bartonella schoenbuchensis]|uniref:helix-turn-helix domain-containing protein n=1 Tax=Bartonella schoenbuchensis TaxID=165694 RepID=UPI003144F0F7